MPKKYRSRPGIVSWLSETSRPIYMIDDRSRLRFFNQGCAALTGCQPEDLIGKTCQYRTDPMEKLAERVLQSFSPPPEVFQGQELITEISFIDSRGEHRTPQVLFLPLLSAEDTLTAVLGVVLELSDIPGPVSATHSQQLHLELAGLMQKYHQQFDQATLIANSPVMKAVSKQVQVARRCTASVLLQGASGTGKEYLARMIHHRSEKKSAPFCQIDCAQIPRTDQRRILKEALTHAGDLNAPGVIFFKGVDQLAIDLQVWLAEMIELNEWPEQYRIVASTENALPDLIQQESFEERFFYAINTIQITLPDLNQREEDFELLCQHFLEKNNLDSEKQFSGFSQEVMDEFQQYDWPGNLRELKLVIDEACCLSSGGKLELEHLPFRFKTGQGAQKSLPIREQFFKSLDVAIEELEKAEVKRALEAAQGNKAKAATLLGLTRAKLYRLLEKFESG